MGDRRLGKKEIVERAKAQLARLGQAQAAAAKEDVGTLRLNVTELSDVPGMGMTRRGLGPGGRVVRRVVRAGAG